jgi:hypothetical protein
MAKHRQSKGRSGVKAKGRAGARTDHAEYIDVRPGAGPDEPERPSAKPGLHGEAAGRRRSNLDAPPQPVVKPERYIAIIPAALALLASINTLWNGFAADDLQQVVNNPSIKKLENIPLVFTTSV